ncbi:uncharacterized protein PGTG_19067 [Puccinia graminis f. sp. tritici CRL 75-36-700-3]|uniref:Domain of unknown function at the cortex 1 domain-containing protein n=1 Tax=Puccinia graminis f. sp. tritici (strain CRL 75-36-700-3 / race SCCL) TaxID=418459 RepID=E3L9S4_PUCGT|nr:uncharacterized protein PGTG_19067 [Puccinia graminis f. sp. tritici CRL 75-36-700-3]EFP93299.2 hypothetical protein PGTG_19067 [Puccinia graminis f. sp. tritici CRL 75-36-700-3]
MKQRGPRFDILAGSSLDELSRVKVNADRSGPLAIKTKSFEGNLTVRMKDFADYNGDIYRDTETNYFANWTDVTWSIQIQGRFLQPTSADDCVFGNTFDKPIRDRLPFGTGAALKAISYIDPSLENDLYADKPWAWSPLLATMNYIRTERLDADDSPLPPCEAATRPVEDCSSLLSGNPTNISKPHLRRKFFSSAVNRQAIMLGPRDFINAEFANGFIDFSTLALNVPVVNVSFKLDKLWDGQPVRYVCQSRKTGETYFVVVFQIVELDAENKLEEDDEDEDAEQTPEQSEVASRRATRGNSAAMRPPDDLISIDEWGVD